jgi:mannose-6-phosphate isomerase
MNSLYPLRFEPIFRQYLWGGRRLRSVLGKPIGPGDDYAESWEVVDHDADQSLVAYGSLRGETLGDLVTGRGEELLGRHHPQKNFPLLFKFLDAHSDLSVQVHPDDAGAALLDPPDLGKTEAWVVLHADLGSKIYAGLNHGVDRQSLEESIAQGRADTCLHQLEPRAGDCLFIPAGTVHALGAGLVVAEIQQASNTTFRLFDWNRVGPDGQPRPLHVDKGLDAVDFGQGPVSLCVPAPLEDAPAERLVACDKFVMDRWNLQGTAEIGGDGGCHLIAVLDGSVTLDGDPCGQSLVRGQTALLPASIGAVSLGVPEKATLLDISLP